MSRLRKRFIERCMHGRMFFMQVFEAIQGRTSTRAFLDRPVSKKMIHSVLDCARWAPSGANTQPWQVAVAGRERMQRIGDKIVISVKDDKKPNPDYQYYADKIPELYRSRQVACGMALYGSLGIDRDDKQRRMEQWMKNYYGFGAPIELFIFIDEVLETGSWIDMGMFIQNIMLAARGFGLETCPQAALAEYPDIVRETLGIPGSMKLICGIAMGYPDSEDPVNNYRTEREEVDTFTRWFLDD